MISEAGVGHAVVDDRRVMNGICWRLRTGAPWSDLPARYGPHMTCVNRFHRWREAGVLGIAFLVVRPTRERPWQRIPP